jgi:signal transduction histidine kinase
VTSVLSEVLVLGRDRQPIQEPCDLATVARDAVEFCGSYASGREIRLDTSALRPAPIVGDPDEMRQIFVNLILNACQASPAESTVRMETFQDEREADGGWSIVRFSDAGAGMTPDVIARVFEPFFSTRKDGGGLGLAVCREIVQRHRGAISIESMPGAGTTVTLRLPRRSR